MRACTPPSRSDFVVGCLPARINRSRACTSFNGLPTRLPPLTVPRHGRARPRPRVSAYAPQRSQYDKPPETTTRCVSCRSVASPLARSCAALAHLCRGGTGGCGAATGRSSRAAVARSARRRRSAGLESRQTVPSGASKLPATAVACPTHRLSCVAISIRTAICLRVPSGTLCHPAAHLASRSASSFALLSLAVSADPSLSIATPT